MKVLVCGSRHFNDYDLLERTLNGLEISEIIEGEAAGADRYARIYGENKGISVRKFPADWNKYGRAAGPIRNSQMLSEGKPDLVVGFLAKNSRGTKNMIEQSKKAGIEVKVIEIG